jgi:hypothetical protein
MAYKNHEDLLEYRRQYRIKNRKRMNAYARQWQKNYRIKNGEAVSAYKSEYDLKRQYGISSAERDAMLQEQGGACAVCKTKEPDGNGRWRVDHCHVSGKVRGILCSSCNLALGLMKDNIASFRRAIIYLNKENNE